MKLIDVINEHKLIHHVWEKIHDNKLKHAICKRCKCEKYFDDRWGKVIFIDRFGKTHHHKTPDCVLPNTKLNETKEISAIKKDKDKEIFDYHGISNNAWHELLQDAQKIQKINFATENDDSTGEKKTFYVKKNLRKDQPIKYQFDAELMEAGGDWEMPVMYFRIQFTHDSFFGNIYKNNKDNPKYAWDVDRKSPKLYKCYVVIPPVEAGNKLTNQYEESSEGNKDNDKWFAYQNNELSKEDEKKARITDADKKSVWKWLEELLAKLVEDNHQMLDENTKLQTILNELFSQSLVQKLVDKFHQEKPELEEKVIRYYLQRFEQLKNSPKVQEKDITKYSWKQLETLVDMNQPRSIKTNVKISDSDLIYNKNNLKIYRANTQQACVKYGNGYSFCISARGEGNMYYEYRYGEGQTIYFVQDLDRTTEQQENGKFVDPHHLIVIMTRYIGYDYNNKPLGWNQTTEEPNEQSWQITTANNDGELDYESFNGIVMRYPKLQGLDYLFKPEQPDPHENEIYELRQTYNKILRKHYKIYEINRLFQNERERDCAKIISTLNDWKFVNDFVNNHEELFVYKALDSNGKELVEELVVGNYDPEKFKKELNDYYSENELTERAFDVKIEKIEPSENMIGYLQKEWEIMSEYLNEKNKINLKYK